MLVILSALIAISLGVIVFGIPTMFVKTIHDDVNKPKKSTWNMNLEELAEYNKTYVEPTKPDSNANIGSYGGAVKAHKNSESIEK